jgi:hypothetical protein
MGRRDAAAAVRELEIEFTEYYGEQPPADNRVAIAAYVQGGLDALKLYAHWKDGVEYVGSCGTTLAKGARDWSTDPTQPTTEKSDND